MADANSLKKQFVDHLKTQGITDINVLWGVAKAFAKKKFYEMGGSYASFGKAITVHLLIKSKQHSFEISLEEVK